MAVKTKALANAASASMGLGNDAGRSMAEFDKQLSQAVGPQSQWHDVNAAAGWPRINVYDIMKRKHAGAHAKCR